MGSAAVVARSDAGAAGPVGASVQTLVGSTAHVCLVYHYTDGHDFTTESMLEDDALAYMPLLHARRVDEHRYVTPFATIELRLV